MSSINQLITVMLLAVTPVAILMAGQGEPGQWRMSEIQKSEKRWDSMTVDLHSILARSDNLKRHKIKN